MENRTTMNQDFSIDQQEIWLPVKDYEGLYEDSNMGRVKSLKFGKERVLRAAKQSNGYLFVTLCKDGKKKNHLVHRLVATSFIPNPHNLPQVNHKDYNPLNNRVENLEFCDAKYNINYGSHNDKVAKALSKTVLQLTLDGKLVREWPSAHEAQRQGGFHQGYISACCRGEYGHKTHKGFIWKYKEQP